MGELSQHTSVHGAAAALLPSKRFTTPDYGRKKQQGRGGGRGEVDQGHIEAVLEAGAGGRCPRASVTLQASSLAGGKGGHAPDTFTPRSHAASAGTDSSSSPAGACLWHFSTGPSQAPARRSKEGASSCPPGLFSPSIPLTPSPGAPWHCWGCLSCSTGWGALAAVGLGGCPPLRGAWHRAECIPASATSIPAGPG